MLAASLDVPLRDQNVLLESAGFPPAFDEPALHGGVPPASAETIDRMLAHHEPYPMFSMTRTDDVLKTNAAAARVFGGMIADPSAVGEPPNLLRCLFDPRLARTFVADWEQKARQLLSRIRRESLACPTDEPLASLAAALLEYPGGPGTFRHLDLTAPSEPTFTLRLRRDGVELAFLATVTAFSVLQDVTLEELRIESYFPLDTSTTQACERPAG